LLLFPPPRCITSKAKREEASPIHPGSALPEEKEKGKGWPLGSKPNIITSKGWWLSGGLFGWIALVNGHEPGCCGLLWVV
jgi:hypothetical protein